MSQRDFEEFEDEQQQQRIASDIDAPDIAAAPIDEEAVEHIGKHGHEGGDDDDDQASNEREETLNVEGYFSLSQLIYDNAVVLPVTEGQAKLFMRTVKGDDGEEETSGNIGQAQVTGAVIKEYCNTHSVSIAPQLAVVNGKTLQSDKHACKGAANGLRYPLICKPNEKVNYTLLKGKCKYGVPIHEHRRLLRKNLVKKWAGVSDAMIDDGVRDIPGTDEKFIDPKNHFYREAFYAYQFELARDFPDFDYPSMVNDAEHGREVRVPGGVVRFLKRLFNEKGRDPVRIGTTDLRALHIKISNPNGENGSWAGIHGQLHNAGIREEYIQDALDTVHYVCFTISIKAVVH